MKAFISCQDKELLQKVFLVHGDPDASIAYKKVLEADGFKNVAIARKGEEIEI